MNWSLSQLEDIMLRLILVMLHSHVTIEWKKECMTILSLQVMFHRVQQFSVSQNGFRSSSVASFFQLSWISLTLFILGNFQWFNPVNIDSSFKSKEGVFFPDDDSLWHSSSFYLRAPSSSRALEFSAFGLYEKTVQTIAWEIFKG